MVTLAAIDREIREGRIHTARAALEKLSRKGAFRSLNVTKLANLHWRVGLPGRGLRLISGRFPTMDPDVLEDHPDEAAEYSVCLIKLGAFEEAKGILSLPGVRSATQAPLYEGFAYVETWDYERAIPHFTRYVKQTRLSEYARLVGLVNLAAAHVYENHHRAARPILSRLQHDASLAKHTFLLGYVLEMAAIQRILEGDLDSADRFLADAEKRWSHVEGLDRFFLEKWRAVLHLKVRPDRKSTAEVEAVRCKAAEIGHWESVRDIDRHLAVSLKDTSRLNRVYFGTPYPAFREKLLHDFGVAAAESYGFPLGEGAGGEELRVLVDSAERTRRNLTGQNLALFSLLASDTYRPQRLATLFGRLFPDEQFSPQSSPKRIHQGIRRLEGWFRKQKLGIFVEEVDSAYRLRSRRPLVLHLPKPGNPAEGWRPLIQRLSQMFRGVSFSVSEAQDRLHIPRRTLLRQIQSLAVSGHLQTTGAGRATRYAVSD